MDSSTSLVSGSTRLPTFYIPHGGGPCFFMDWPDEMGRMWDPLAGFLRGLRATVPERPRAILVVSAHWEAERPTVTTAADPELLFDYYGFPPHTYELRYPAPGSPELAARVRAALDAAGIASDSDARRGFDHGVFVPFMLIEPQAAIPIVALSLVAGLDPAEHLAIGRALAPLRDEGVLIVGSGMSYHNLRAFLAGRGPGALPFDQWLTATVLADPATRTAGLRAWESAPDARLAHPREEHLIPLLVAAGAAGDDFGTRVFHDRISGAEVSGYRFG